jgi:hypothetical protein
VIAVGGDRSVDTVSAPLGGQVAGCVDLACPALHRAVTLKTLCIIMRENEKRMLG